MAWNLFGKKKKENDDSTDQPESVDSEQAAPEEKPQKAGFFGSIKKALVKTYRVLNTDIKDVF